MNPETANSDKILTFLVGKESMFGTGHIQRCNEIILELIKKSNFLHTPSMQYLENSIDKPADILVLDCRDEAFPKENIKSSTKITIDNRGIGRTQADLIWDTLPHMDMNLEEICISLQNCIIPKDIRAHACQSETGKIIREPSLQIAQKKYLEGFIHHNNPEVVIDNFREKIIHSNPIITYYGLTMFEALYLGKTVVVYDISDYHQRLADWWYRIWNNSLDVRQSLDGLGVDRFIHKISSFI
jgi:hypothetical protein